MIFPFVAVEGQEKIKKALLLNIVNKRIGGVLINGEKGTAKSTLVRGLGELFSEIKVINLPLNITEDNLVGSIDIEKTMKSGKKVFQEGLLKKCHNNILYVDEINLLGDSIVSSILEVASREINYVERDGVSFSHECKFLLIGTMNPEEGDLRPQLLDKFGLYVNAAGTEDILERVKVIKKRLEYENNPIKFCEKYKEEEEILKEKVEHAKERIEKIKVSDQIMNIAVKIVEEANTVGNRAEIILVETAKSLAALDGRSYLNIDDLKEAAVFVLPHRTNQKHESTSQSKGNELEDKNQETEEEKNNSEDNITQEKEVPEEPNKENFDNGNDSENIEESDRDEKKNKNNENAESEEEFGIGEIFKVKDILIDDVHDTRKRAGTGKRCKTKSGSLQGRYIKSTLPKGKIRDFAFDATIRAAAPYQKKNKENNLMINIKKEHIRVKVREKRTGASILFVVDSSGSMGVKKRMEAVKGAVMSLLKDAYEKRDRVGMVSFRRDKAEELLPITRSIDLAQKKLEKLATGGKTPLAEGIAKAYTIIKNEMRKDKEVVPLIVFLSDGKGNFSASGKDPVKESLEMAEKIKNEGIRAIVIDTEEGFIKLEMAKTLSEAMKAEYYKLENLRSEDMLKLIKDNI
ncbi:magnesium chelatase subunit D family protein [Fusobacterium varium]|jgi:magnesium chelatase subunit D|uniref:VWA domain-containing protein n=1 Tax=Fusobacterium varium ATCC 27725 TaxID=469618 RepID=A0ABM6U3L8_FUSVA|nr:magnesium chelatase subunit D family protein [Fusobacterium varium]AVQ30916.1 VWA domain-containing protein [Fusobacterium varium ATCC 27725]EES63730.1 von Willebrand factor type A domain protein [Fusobacterium varium ATCC 27725]